VEPASNRPNDRALKTNKDIAMGRRGSIRIALLAIWLVAAAAETAGAGKGLVSETFAPDYYEIPRLIEGDSLAHNPTFIVYGDSRPGWRIKESFYRKKNWWTWKQVLIPFYQIYWLGNGAVGSVNGIRNVPDYGDKQARRVRDAVYDEAKRSDVDFILHLGDFATDGRYPHMWKPFIDQNKFEVPLVLEFPLLPIVGNHEHANDSVYGMPNYRAVFDYEPFYVFESPHVDFFVVDSDIIIDQHQLMDDDVQDELFEKWFVAPGNPGTNGRGADGPTAWLERKLAASTKTFKVVAMHHPPLVFAGHYGNWTDPKNGRGILEKRRALIDLMVRNGVQFVLAGHQHLYEHNVLTAFDGQPLAAPLHVVITGGAGSPLQPGADEEEIAAQAREYLSQGFTVANLKQDVVYNYCLVDVTPDVVSIDVYEVPDRSDATAVLIDSISIPVPTAHSSR
jgi:hypothetical protein